jgi:LemA protein
MGLYLLTVYGYGDVMVALALPICAGFVVLVLAVLAIFYIVSVFNGLITLRNNIDKAWANIDVLLKQRSDLIPNLVETVKGYMKYERKLLTDVTSLRASLMAAQTTGEKARHSEGISAALKSIFAVSEKYPQLKANEGFLDLQKQLVAMENEIADRREFYNDSVLLYNTRIKSLPDMLFAIPLGFRERDYFRAAEEEKAPVNVKME